MATNNGLTLMVRNREAVVFEGEVQSISSKNKKGKFDILHNHGNFITLVNATLVVRPKGGGAFEEIEVTNGVMRVVENKVEVFVGKK